MAGVADDIVAGVALGVVDGVTDGVAVGDGVNGAAAMLVAVAA